MGTEWLFVWLIANALFVVWRVLVVSQAESRHLSIRRQIAGQPLSLSRSYGGGLDCKSRNFPA